MTELNWTAAHRMYNLLQFWNVIESMATFTVAMSVLGLLGLLFGNESFEVDTSVSI